MKPFMSLTVDTSALDKDLVELIKGMPIIAGAALFEEANDIMERPNGARDQAPVDIGTLRESGFVNAPLTEGDEVSVVLGFGGAASAYAWRQHEELTWRHPKHGKAKYLEDPMNESRAGFDERIGKKLEQMIGEVLEASK